MRNFDMWIGRVLIAAVAVSVVIFIFASIWNHRADGLLEGIGIAAFVKYIIAYQKEEEQNNVGNE